MDAPLIHRQLNETPEQVVAPRNVASAHRRWVFQDRDRQLNERADEAESTNKTLSSICHYHMEHIEALEKEKVELTGVIDKLVCRDCVSQAPLTF